MANSDSIKYHFAGKSPLVRELNDLLLTMLHKFGSIVEEPKKTSIHLVNVSALAGVEVRQNYLLLNIKTDYPIDNPRIERSERISVRRFHHRVRITATAEIDDELKRWLKDAYNLSGARRNSTA